MRPDRSPRGLRFPRGLRLALALLAAAPAASAQGVERICTLVIDASAGETLAEEGDCHARVTPASTFKLPLAVMGFEAGILRDASHPVMSFRPGDPDWGGEPWRRDTDPAAWMRHSVVWYSQRITRALGAETLQRQARAFTYGNADVSGDPGRGNGLERAWLSSSLQISPHEQAAFLRALIGDALPASPEAMRKARAIVETREIDGWTLHGKTGAAFPRRPEGGFDYARGWGWYVGWAETAGRRLVFVTLSQGRARSATSPGHAARDAFLSRWTALATP